MINKFLILAAFITASFAFATSLENDKEAKTKYSNSEKITVEKENTILSAAEEIERLYRSFAEINTTMPSLVSFTNAITGYNKLVEENKIENELLTIVDFSLPSTEKRMWILDMATNKVLRNTYVAHGKNTGNDMASKFSNVTNSFQSSLGFYVTGETYYGKNGLSLFIDGQEEEFNSNARSRYVVVHGADYATPEFIEKNGRLGRSLGCPAVPREETKEVINAIKGKSCLFIYHPNKEYAKNSTYLNPAA